MFKISLTPLTTNIDVYCCLKFRSINRLRLDILFTFRLLRCYTKMAKLRLRKVDGTQNHEYVLNILLIRIHSHEVLTNMMEIISATFAFAVNYV